MAKKPKKEIESCSVREYRNVSELNLHPDNPREISRERLNDLKESIIKKGFYEPILIWGENNYVLSGNHRLVAIRELIAEGWKINGGSLSPVNQLPVVECDCDEATAIAILFETNNRYANWIEEKVREALNAADSSELKGYGFSSAELDIWIAKAEDEARDTMSAIYDDDSSEYDLPDERPAPDAKPREKLSSSEYAEQKALVLPQLIYNKLLRLLTLFAAQNDLKIKEGDVIAMLDAFCDSMMLEDDDEELSIDD